MLPGYKVHDPKPVIFYHQPSPLCIIASYGIFFDDRVKNVVWLFSFWAPHVGIHINSLREALGKLE